MAELAGAISVALEQLTVDDDPGADAAPDLDDDQVVRPWPPIERQLGQRGRVAVVGDHDGHTVAARHERPQRKVGPFEVDRPADGPRAGVDHARGADADAEERGRVIGSQGVDEPEDELDGGLAVSSFEGQLHGAQDVAAQVDDGAAELRVGKVEADQQTAFRGDAEQDR